MATHFCSLAWRIPGKEEPGGLPSMGSHRVGHNWSNLAAAAALYSQHEDKPLCPHELLHTDSHWRKIGAQWCSEPLSWTPTTCSLSHQLLLSLTGCHHLCDSGNLLIWGSDGKWSVDRRGHSHTRLQTGCLGTPELLAILRAQGKAPPTSGLTTPGSPEPLVRDPGTWIHPSEGRHQPQDPPGPQAPLSASCLQVWDTLEPSVSCSTHEWANTSFRTS